MSWLYASASYYKLSVADFYSAALFSLALHLHVQHLDSHLVLEMSGMTQNTCFVQEMTACIKYR
jgi:hypothetical protein